MAPHLAEVAALVGGLYRVGRNDRPVFRPAPWKDVGKGRYDDPLGGGRSVPPIYPFPERSRFRVVYCSSSLTGSFAESLQKFRTSLTLVADLYRSGVLRHASVEDVLGDVANVRDDIAKGVVPERWTRRRHFGRVDVPPSLHFADVCASRTLSVLRSVPYLAQLAERAGLHDIDVSAVTGPHRSLTQACARYIYEARTEAGEQFSGIRYVSRLGEDVEWECWALFDDRAEVDPVINSVQVTADVPELRQAADILRLDLERAQ